MKRKIAMILSVCAVQVLYSSDEGIGTPLERAITSTSPMSLLGEGTCLTPGVSELVGRCRECLVDLNKEVALLTTIGKKMEQVRVVRQALVKIEQFGGCHAMLTKNKKTQRSVITLTRRGDTDYNYELALLNEDEGTHLCQVLTEYLDPSSKSTGEQNIRALIGLREKALFNQETLKSFLDEMRSSVPQEESVVMKQADFLLDQLAQKQE